MNEDTKAAFWKWFKSFDPDWNPDKEDSYGVRSMQAAFEAGEVQGKKEKQQ